jgi:RimJ/RimL family protein N-acetyltransferase
MVNLRSAGREDEDRLLAWRNDLAARSASFTSDEISAEVHHAWFARKLQDPDCALLIIEEDGRPVGQVRLDRVADDVAEVSIALAPEARGRGLGRQALEVATAKASERLGVASIKAIVKPTNDSSLAAFRAAGFAIVRNDADAVELLRRSGDDSPAE